MFEMWLGGLSAHQSLTIPVVCYVGAKERRCMTD